MTEYDKGKMKKLNNKIILLLIYPLIFLIHCRIGGNLYYFKDDRYYRIYKNDDDLFRIEISMSYMFGAYLFMNGECAITNKSNENAIFNSQEWYVKSENLPIEWSDIEGDIKNKTKYKGDKLIVPPNNTSVINIEFDTRELKKHEFTKHWVYDKKIELYLGKLEFSNHKINLGPYTFVAKPDSAVKN
jgi:hypothetical protein